MILLNLFAQPGAGKTSSAAFIFAYLKNRSCNVENITEYAKKMVYAKRYHEMQNQLDLMSNQYKQMKDIEMYEKVPLLITDSPLLLGLMYSEKLHYFNELSALFHKIHNTEFENINVLVKRTKPYNPSGRNETEAQSDALALKAIELIDKFDYIINGDEEGQLFLAKEIYSKYGDRIKIRF